MDMPNDKDKFIELFFPQDLLMRKRGDYIANNANPWYAADVLMRCIANKIGSISIESPKNEGNKEAVLRFKIAKGHTEVLEHLMDDLENNIMPALQRLHNLQYPDDIKIDK